MLYNGRLRLCVSFTRWRLHVEVTQQDVVAESRLQSCSTEECRMPIKSSEKGNSETKHVICSKWISIICDSLITGFSISQINIGLQLIAPQTEWFIQVQQGKFNS